MDWLTLKISQKLAICCLVFAFGFCGTASRLSAQQGPASRQIRVDQISRSQPASSARDSAAKPLFQQMGSSNPQSTHPTKSHSLIKQAAHGQVIAEPLPRELQPVSYHHPGGHGDGCPSCTAEAICGCDGPVCGCDAPVFSGRFPSGGTACGPTCGIAGPGCGADFCDGCDAGFHEPACGVGYSHGPIDCIPVLFPILPINWNRFEFFAGAQGFTGPQNYAVGRLAGNEAGSGSFGFFQGFNEGRSLQPLLGVDWAAQFGLRATQNNFDGAFLDDQRRNQLFLTAGISRRVDYGLQMGVVYDYLNDHWNYKARIGQVRGELSWVLGNCHEFGYRFMAQTNRPTVTIAALQNSITLAAINQHRFFYRYDLGRDGFIDAFVGPADSGATVLGVDLQSPFRGNWGFRGGFAYLNPGRTNVPAYQEESWNISFGVAWRPCGPTKRCEKYYKPLFDVADNGTFMVTAK